MKPPKPTRTNHLILMVKHPKIGCVKTRLGKDIGMVRATQFYRHTAYRLITQLAQDPRWQTHIAIAPDTAITGWNKWPTKQKESQGDGNLGDRMQRLFKAHAPHPTLIIGTDVPAITKTHINAAFKQLHKTGTVLGPSGDGGYWCIGQTNTPRTLMLFHNVRWSTPHALKDTQANIKELANLKGKAPNLTSQLKDIDIEEDFNTSYRMKRGRWL